MKALLYFRVMKKFLISFTLIFSLIELKAEKVYEFNSLCQQAYKEITQLKLNNGLVSVESMDAGIQGNCT